MRDGIIPPTAATAAAAPSSAWTKKRRHLIHQRIPGRNFQYWHNYFSSGGHNEESVSTNFKIQRTNRAYDFQNMVQLSLLYLYGLYVVRVVKGESVENPNDVVSELNELLRKSIVPTYTELIVDNAAVQGSSSPNIKMNNIYLKLPFFIQSIFKFNVLLLDSDCKILKNKSFYYDSEDHDIITLIIREQNDGSSSSSSSSHYHVLIPHTHQTPDVSSSSSSSSSSDIKTEKHEAISSVMKLCNEKVKDRGDLHDLLHFWTGVKQCAAKHHRSRRNVAAFVEGGGRWPRRARSGESSQRRTGHPTPAVARSSSSSTRKRSVLMLFGPHRRDHRTRKCAGTRV